MPNGNVNQNIIVALRSHARLFLGRDGNEDGEYLLEGVRVRTGFPPWPSSADLLVHQDTREFCGVTYQVGDEFRPLVRTLAGVLDSRCVRYVAGEGALRSKTYRDGPGDLEFLEIVWSDVLHDQLLPAQLSGDVWYMSSDKSTTATPVERVVGYGIGDLEELTREHQLIMPSRFAFPTDLRVVKVDLGKSPS